MKLTDLRSQYSDKDLRRSMGEQALRFKAFSPFFQNLHEGKVVYYEKFMCIARLDDLEITPEGIYALAVPVTPIPRVGLPENLINRYVPPEKPWRVGMRWEWMMMNVVSLGNPQIGWTVWPEAERVQAVEKLIEAGDFGGVMNITLLYKEDEKSS
jgi:hypothetical protein